MLALEKATGQANGQGQSDRDTAMMLEKDRFGVQLRRKLMVVFTI